GVVEVGKRIDITSRLVEGILQAAEDDRMVVEDDVAGPRVAVAGLADAADVDHDVLLVELELIVAIFGRNEAIVGREDARQMRVTLEAVLLDAAEEGVHLPLVVD